MTNVPPTSIVELDLTTDYRIHIGTDHAGLELSHLLQRELSKLGYEVIDHGPESYDPDDDYPSFCIDAARGVVREDQSGNAGLGIVIGGSGNGEQIAANKVHGIRAALVWSPSTARLAREHNYANVIAIGARQHTPEECLELVLIFLRQPFSHEPRHVRRIDQIAAYELGYLSDRG